jgi:hypothetical protein
MPNAPLAEKQYRKLGRSTPTLLHGRWPAGPRETGVGFFGSNMILAGVCQPRVRSSRNIDESRGMDDNDISSSSGVSCFNVAYRENQQAV